MYGSGSIEERDFESLTRSLQGWLGSLCVEIEALSVAGAIGKLPALHFYIETGLGVRKTLSRQMDYRVCVFEMILQPVRFAEIRSVSGTDALSGLDSIEHRYSTTVLKNSRTTN